MNLYIFEMSANFPFVLQRARSAYILSTFRLNLTFGFGFFQLFDANSAAANRRKKYIELA